MNFYKNIEIARKYNVSVDTVANWITGSLEHRNKLEIYYRNGRNFVVNNSTNNILLEELSNKSRRFKNRRSLKIIKPKDEFYEVFTEKQIIEIIYNLEESKEIPFKYCHLGKGAKYWDDYIHRLLKSKEPASIKRTITAFNQSLEYLKSLIKKYDYINIIDIGVGNGLHIKPLLDYVIQKKQLRKYIGIDISPQMLSIALNNYKNWYGDNFPYETHIKDINYDIFQDISLSNKFPSDSNFKIVNIVVYVGSCIENQKTYHQSLLIIKESIQCSDIFILGHILDNKEMRTHLYFNEREKRLNGDLEFEAYILDLLNITSDLYEMYRYYDENQDARFISIRLKVDIKLYIETSYFKKEISLYAKDNIIVFRHNHHTSYEVNKILSEANFNILNINISEDNNQIMTISRKSKPEA